MESPLLERTTTFLEAIAKRIDKDNGAKAAMKRALTGEKRHLLTAYPLVLPWLCGVKEHQQDLWILVASLSAFYPQSMQSEVKNFGLSCKKLNDTSTSGGTEKRFRALLDLSLEDIETPISSLIRQMKSKSISISYPLLLANLCQWEHPDQYIQDQWAKTFWSSSNSEKE